MTIAFDPVLLTGIEEIDAEHRELFARVERLVDASRARRGKEEVLALLDFLGSYVTDHFAHEEARMLGYPGAAAHELEHRRFAREVNALRAEARAKGPSPLLVIQVGNRVATWLREHIYRTDRALGEWLRGRRTAG